MYESVPEELKLIPNWVNATSDKIPRDPKTGAYAKTTDPTTWGTFEDAVTAKQKYGFDQIGFVFDGHNGYFGVDLDHCLDNVDFCDESRGDATVLCGDF